MNTAIRNAFFAAKFPRGYSETPVGQAIVKVAGTQAGVLCKDKGWNAKLSFRTANALKADGTL